jgi:hypothetical protein
MKTIYYIVSLCLLLALFHANRLEAQCSPLIDATTRVTATGNIQDTSFASFHSKYLVCHNAQLYYYGNSPDTIFLEGSARLVIGMCWNLTVYMRPNAMLQIDTSQLGMKRIGSIVYQPLFVGFQDTAGVMIDTMITCTALGYNYSAFPSGISPCGGMIATDAFSDFRSGLLYPVPAQDYIYLPDNIDPKGEYRIYSVQGKCLETGKIERNRISIEALAAGQMYMMILNTGGHTHTYTFMK